MNIMTSSQVPTDLRGDPWFEDGNIILVSEGDEFAFKVHRGVLSRHSEVFLSLFDIPQPNAPDIQLDGCPVVNMHDPHVELSNLIRALYDGVHFWTRGIEDFFYLAGILRLSTKYFINHLRIQAIRHLTETWASTLDGHDAMLERALKSPLSDGTSYPYVHPLLVLNLAREVNVRVVVPSTLYFLSLYPLEDLLRGDHPKLQISHPSRPSSKLSINDIKDYTLMYQHRIDVIISFVNGFSRERPCVASGASSPTCPRAFNKLGSRLARSWISRTGPLHYIMQAKQELSDDPNVCAACRRKFNEEIKTMRDDLWAGLPGVIKLPSWQDLEDMDLRPGDLRT